MGLFNFFYRVNLYGIPLYDHLNGWDDSLNDYNTSFYQFDAIFLKMMGIVILVFLLYYYIINQPRLNRTWHWVIALLVVLFANFLFPYLQIMADIGEGFPHDQSLANDINGTNAFLFGIYNSILSGIFFLLFTIFFRRWSKNCKHSPWKVDTLNIFNKKIKR